MTDITLFYEKEYATIQYSEVGQYIMIAWTIPPISKEFREAMEMLLEAMKQFKTGKLIFDNRNAGALLPDDQEWSLKDWHGRALAAGHTHVAIVQSPDIFAQISSIEVVSHVRIPTAFFESVSDAVSWITDPR